jgi:hypothetical protein
LLDTSKKKDSTHVIHVGDVSDGVSSQSSRFILQRLAMVYHSQYYQVSGFCHHVNISNRIQHFRNWISFCSQVNIFGNTHSVVSVRKNCSQSLDTPRVEKKFAADLYEPNYS